MKKALRVKLPQITVSHMLRWEAGGTKSKFVIISIFIEHRHSSRILGYKT
jgi:hypothetical protein